MASLPRILCLLDKNPLSPTYGSFDRKFWQYKIIDFPCGMQQSTAALAYLWKTDFPENRYYISERIREYIEGALLFHRKCCHSDGSMDDYFPHERAFGATAYALAASTEQHSWPGSVLMEFCRPLRKPGISLPVIMARACSPISAPGSEVFGR